MTSCRLLLGSKSGEQQRKTALLKRIIPRRRLRGRPVPPKRTEPHNSPATTQKNLPEATTTTTHKTKKKRRRRRRKRTPKKRSPKNRITTTKLGGYWASELMARYAPRVTNLDLRFLAI